jgi:exodeoxyribonuclease VII small subunit
MSSEDSGSTLDFEQALAQLEGIVHQLEEGSIGLSEALARYEQGVHLLKKCYEMLERAERKIEQLTGVDASGKPIVAAMEDDEQSLEQKSQTRSRRRSTRGQTARAAGDDACPEPDMDAF